MREQKPKDILISNPNDGWDESKDEALRQPKDSEMRKVQLFLSAVSAEFRHYREALRKDLDQPNVSVKIQEDFIAAGVPTLDKLDDYIRSCDLIIHLVGQMTGGMATSPALEAIMRTAVQKSATVAPG